MASTDLKLEEPGSLQRPGPVGRFVRLTFGMMSLSYVTGLMQVSQSLLQSDGHVQAVIWNGIFAGLLLVSYVINIGYSRHWKKWPAIVSAAVFTATAAAGYLSHGTVETSWLAGAIWVWEIYIFSHLGVAFVLSGLIATPGCEMRAFHDLYSRLTGAPTREHHCPIGPLTPIDRWEAGRSSHN
jgi:hypothetical protein